MTTIAIVHGTGRRGNYSAQVTARLAAIARTLPDVSVESVSAGDEVREHVTVPPWAEGGTETVPTRWQDIALRADGFIFVLPEYNRGYPGEWKLLMDTLYREYEDKPAGIVGVSDGIFGGARVIEHVKPVLVEMGFVVLRGALHIAHVDTAFLPDGSFADPNEEDRARAFVTRVAATAERYTAVRYTKS